MKKFKPTLEVLEGRLALSGFWDPGPGGGTPLPTGPFGGPILAGKVGGTTWQPGPNIFYNPRAPQGGSGVSIEFVSAGVVDPLSDMVYLESPKDAETGVAVSVPDGGTMLLGGVKASPKSITLVEVLTAAKTPLRRS